MDVFRKPGDFAAFVTILEEGRQRVKMRILAYCLMNNHWHIVLWPGDAGDLSNWRWSSLGGGAGVDGKRVQLTQWAVARPDGSSGSMPWWPTNSSSGCGCASGAAGHSPDDAWVRGTARRLGLESTLRDPWRPKKPSPPAKKTDSRR